MTPDDFQTGVARDFNRAKWEIKEGYIYLQISRGVAPRHHAYDRFLN